MDKITEKLGEMRVDVMFGKKKHFNAADRNEKCHHWIGMPAIIINIITASIIFYIIVENSGIAMKYLSLILVLISTILSFVQMYFNFPRQVIGHKRVANKYLALMKKIERIQIYISNGYISGDEIMENMEKTANEIEDINREADLYHTNNEDYEKARIGIDNGEEYYTEKELNNSN
ncbi:hypothetical protein AGMMS49574_28390 [Bacteroidia bacterium]|nr:hypothetical protein AGMMS49574_28390 [Bacteroidia bacterium]